MAISLVTRLLVRPVGRNGEAGMWLLTVIGTDSQDLAGVNLFLAEAGETEAEALILGEDFGGLGLGNADLADAATAAADRGRLC